MSRIQQIANTISLGKEKKKLKDKQKEPTTNGKKNTKDSASG